MRQELASLTQSPQTHGCGLRSIGRLLARGTALIALLFPASATAGVRIANVDSSALPTIGVTVVTSSPSSRTPRVTENGTAVADLSAQNLGNGESVMLAVDRSQSMHGRALADAVTAALRFLALQRASDRIAVMSFASQILTASDFSASRDEASAALRSLTDDPRYGTTLYDAVVQASHALSAQGRPGRVLVLVTDGQETTSKASLAQAVRAARAAHVLVYPVAIESSASRLLRFASSHGKPAAPTTVRPRAQRSRASMHISRANCGAPGASST